MKAIKEKQVYDICQMKITIEDELGRKWEQVSTNNDVLLLKEKQHAAIEMLASIFNLKGTYHSEISWTVNGEYFDSDEAEITFNEASELIALEM